MTVCTDQEAIAAGLEFSELNAVQCSFSSCEAAQAVQACRLSGAQLKLAYNLVSLGWL